MNFYDQCCNLRKFYNDSGQTILYVNILAKLLTYVFEESLECLPVDKTVYLNCTDLTLDLIDIAAALDQVLLDLGYPNHSISTQSIYRTVSTPQCLSFVVLGS